MAGVIAAPVGALGLYPQEIAAARVAALHRPVPVDTSVRVGALVGEHARLHPRAVAICADGRSVSYAELAAAVTRLAGRLSACGVERGQVVAVSAGRCAEVVIAFLALEAIGGVYVPVDTTWPAHRRRQVVVESGAVGVLTDGSNGADRYDGVPAWPLATSAGPAATPPPAETPEWDDEPRYVIFTSGTTGTPKGAVVEHRGMVNHLQAKVADLGLTAADRIAFTAPIGFDISVWQMLAPLVVGACVVVLDDSTVRFPRRLVRALSAQSVTVAEVVPTIAAALAHECGRGTSPAPALRWLLTTGEELRPPLAAALLQALPDVALLNAYGPTECSDDVTHHVVTAADTAGLRIPIGTPVANCDLYLLVEEAGEWRAAKPGEPAQLFVGGVSVGRGYLGQPELTERAFFADELDPRSPTGRLYRTGDLVRLDDGVLAYLGRVDRQVKVGGVRIELDEIEAVLARHGGVADCAVVLGRTGRVDAYVVASGTAFAVEGLLAHARAWLPAAAVPSGCHLLAQLPRTGNGKVDHRALSRIAPSPAQDETNGETVASR